MTHTPLSVDGAQELAPVFAALADPVRLRLLSIVAAQGEVCSCNLEEPLGRSQPTVSHHTTVLAAAGLITGEKRGRWMWWTIVPAQLAAIRRILGDQEGQPERSRSAP
jgi:ArsR family transcriptional regulator